MNALTSNSITAILYPGEYNITPTSGTDGVYYGTYAWPAGVAAWRTANR